MMSPLEQTTLERFRRGARPDAPPFPRLRATAAPSWDLALAALFLIAFASTAALWRPAPGAAPPAIAGPALTVPPVALSVENATLWRLAGYALTPEAVAHRLYAVIAAEPDQAVVITAPTPALAAKARDACRESGVRVVLFSRGSALPPAPKQ